MSSHRAAFTLIELLVVMTIVAILAGMLLPAITSVRQAARGARCLGNIRQLHLATEVYSNENEALLPIVYYGSPGVVPWPLALAQYLVPDVNYANTSAAESNLIRNAGLICPGYQPSHKVLPAPPERDMGFYGRNRQLRNAGGVANTTRNLNSNHIRKRAEGCLYIENDNAVAGVGVEAGHNRIWCVQATAYRHRRTSVVYCDGHTGTVDAATLTTNPANVFWSGQ